MCPLKLLLLFYFFILQGYVWLWWSYIRFESSISRRFVNCRIFYWYRHLCLIIWKPNMITSSSDSDFQCLVLHFWSNHYDESIDKAFLKYLFSTRLRRKGYITFIVSFLWTLTVIIFFDFRGWNCWNDRWFQWRQNSIWWSKGYRSKYKPSKDCFH